MADVCIGLGANLGDPEENLRRAVISLGEGIRIREISSLYRSEPVGFRDQPFFLNAAALGSSELPPWELLALFLGVEREMGRVRTVVPMGPRTLDLDLLLYGDLVMDEPGLRLPHARMAERRFVLEPLAEIAPDVVHPVSGLTVAELLGALPQGQSVERIEREGWPPAV